MRDVSSSINFLDRAQINFSLVSAVSDFTIRGKFSRGKRTTRSLFVPSNDYVFVDTRIRVRLSLCAHRNVYLFTFHGTGIKKRREE